MTEALIRTASGIPGFRWWLIRNGQLCSPWRPSVRWQPGANTADCLYRRRLLGWHPAKLTHPIGVPDRGCTCGFYGLHRAPTTIGFAQSPRGWLLDVSCSGGRERLIFGVAEASGRTVVGTQGWRSQRAEVRALFLGSNRPCRDLDAIQERYRVPVYRDLEMLVGEWTNDLDVGTAAA
jgi:hypothetical protein